MTEKEMLIAAFKREGIEYKEDKEKNIITVERGYSGFSTEIQFRDDGALCDIWAWE
jgi:hypothetical protein